MSSNNTCVCCGDVIPEGRMVCPICESGAALTEASPVDNAGQYVVIVISDRELVEVKLVESLEAGVNYANELLDELLGANGLNYFAGLKTGEWGKATTENPLAWCTYLDDDWDAYVAKLGGV